jgi:hypothetical protein
MLISGSLMNNGGGETDDGCTIFTEVPAFEGDLKPNSVDGKCCSYFLRKALLSKITCITNGIVDELDAGKQTKEVLNLLIHAALYTESRV